MENESKSVSHKELRETFYRLRDFEISNLWQRSIFLSALLVLLLHYGVNESGMHWAVLTALFFIMLIILNSAVNNRWAPSGCLNE